MLTRRIKFENMAGETLAAKLDFPLNGRPRAFALFAHCFTCSANYRYVRNISRALCAGGIAVFRFDFTGLGESGGEFADTNFSSNVDDLVAAADHLAATHRAPEILIGHSWGGTAVIRAAERIPSAAAVVTIGAPSDPAHVARHLEGVAEIIEKEGEAEVRLAGRSFRIKKQFLDDLETTRMQDAIRHLGRALLVCHSPVDEIVGIDNAQVIFKTARHPKSFVSLDGADHLLSEEADSCYVGSVVAAWAGRYLDAPTEPEPAEDKSEVVARTGRERYRTEIAAGAYTLTSDEPASLGGKNMGPTPYQYVLSGLGACTSIALRMFADKNRWPLDEIVVRLRHHKVHAPDCGDCDTAAGKIDQIDQDIDLVGPLDDEQRERLLEIAGRCPVHRTLRSEVVVNTRIKQDDA